MIDVNSKDEQLAYIKKPNELLNAKSKEELEFYIKEIARCRRDIKYFAEKYFKIINLDVGLTTIKLYPKQKELLDFFVNEKRCIVLASRQSSKTTTYTIYALWLCMFHSEKKIMLLANKADTALEILSRIRMAYEYCPAFLKPGVFVWNKGEVVFANRSAIKGFATASDAARGYSANCVGKNVKINIRFKKFPFIKFHISIKYLRFFSKDYYYGLVNNIIRKITMS